MLTIFTIPKPFCGHIKIIQYNAIRSWLKLDPNPEIILFGNEEGMAKAAAELGIKHVPDIECTEYGTPLISSVFAIAQDIATGTVVSYVNADIVLMNDFQAAIRQIQMPRYLLVGQRWDIDVTEPLDFNNSEWESEFKTRLAKYGSLHAPTGIDYFTFPCGTYPNILPFAIGRFAWDNWLIYKARTLGLPVIDGTKVITIGHQNHDYSHIPEAQIKAGPEENVGIEEKRNRELLGGDFKAFTLWAATHFLTPDGLEKSKFGTHLIYKLLRLPEMYPNMFPLTQILIGLRTCLLKIHALRHHKR